MSSAPPTPERAALAEQAVLRRHLRRVWALPGTRLGIVAAPATSAERLLLRWHYWWQAHLLDTLVDAQLRSPTDRRRRTIRRVIRGHRLRNLGAVGNDYNDDMAWWALALDRADPMVRADLTARIERLTDRLESAWDPAHGGVPWRRNDDFLNVPASGSVAILLARRGSIAAAIRTVDWLDTRLRHPDDGLFNDGLRPDPTARGGYAIVDMVYTYCQGVVLGAELELVIRTGTDPMRIHRLVAAVADRMADRDERRGVLIGHSGGDGGLFTGILARYLAQVAVHLPGAGVADEQTRRTAARLVMTSAEAAWQHRAERADLPVFGADWAVPARLPDHGGAGSTPGNARLDSSRQPERDLSVQLSGWMLMEAADLLRRKGSTVS